MTTVAHQGHVRRRICDLIVGELQIADCQGADGLSLFTDFENFSDFKPAPRHEKSFNAVLDQVIAGAVR